MDQKTVDRLKPNGKRALYRDSEVSGLYRVVQPTGATSWRYQRDLWRDGARLKTVYCFTDGDKKLAHARDWAAALQIQINQGVDPTEPDKPTPTTAAAGDGPETWTVKDALDKRRAHMVATGLSANSIEGFDYSVKYLVTLHHITLGKLTKTLCRAAHKAITERGMHGKPAPYPANKAIHHLSATWKYARRFDEREALPVEPPTAGVFLNKEHKREGRIGPDQLPIWATRVAALPSAVRREYQWIALLTGLRDNTLQVIERKWISDDRIIIPGAAIKSRRDYTVPLSVALRAHVKAALAAAEVHDSGGKWLFPSVKAASGHLMESKEPTLKGWTIHNLRKCYRTQAEAEVPKNIARSLIDHNTPGLDGNYVTIAHLFNDRMKWQEHLSARILSLCGQK